MSVKRNWLEITKDSEIYKKIAEINPYIEIKESVYFWKLKKSCDRTKDENKVQKGDYMYVDIPYSVVIGEKTKGKFTIAIDRTEYTNIIESTFVDQKSTIGGDKKNKFDSVVAEICINEVLKKTKDEFIAEFTKKAEEAAALKAALAVVEEEEKKLKKGETVSGTSDESLKELEKMRESAGVDLDNTDHKLTIDDKVFKFKTACNDGFSYFEVNNKVCEIKEIGNKKDDPKESVGIYEDEDNKTVLIVRPTKDDGLEVYTLPKSKIEKSYKKYEKSKTDKTYFEFIQDKYSAKKYDATLNNEIESTADPVVATAVVAPAVTGGAGGAGGGMLKQNVKGFLACAAVVAALTATILCIAFGAKNCDENEKDNQESTIAEQVIDKEIASELDLSVPELCKDFIDVNGHATSTDFRILNNEKIDKYDLNGRYSLRINKDNPDKAYIHDKDNEKEKVNYFSYNFTTINEKGETVNGQMFVRFVVEKDENGNEVNYVKELVPSYDEENNELVFTVRSLRYINKDQDNISQEDIVEAMANNAIRSQHGLEPESIDELSLCYDDKSTESMESGVRNTTTEDLLKIIQYIPIKNALGQIGASKE